MIPCSMHPAFCNTYRKSLVLFLHTIPCFKTVDWPMVCPSCSYIHAHFNRPQLMLDGLKINIIFSNTLILNALQEIYVPFP